MNASSCVSAVVGASLAALLIPSAASAQTFSLVVDNSITPPYGTAFGMVAPPAVSGGEVLFQASITGQTANDTGLFKGAPTTYQTLAKVGDPLPGTTYTLTSFSSTLGSPSYAPVFDGTGRSACSIYCTGGPGLASWNGQTMEGAILAGGTVPIPGGIATFANIGGPAISNGVIAFTGGNLNAGELGAYTSSTAALARIADKNSAIPGGTGNFTNFHTRCTIHNGTVAFLATGGSGQIGVYTGNGGTLTRIADTTTPVPGGTGTFGSFLSPVITSAGVSFVGLWGASQSGIYTTIGGSLTRVVDSQTTYPGSGGVYMVSDVVPVTAQLAGSDSRLAFIARRTDTFAKGLFAWDGSGVTKLVESGQTFQGGYVYDPDMGPQAVDGNKVGFKVTTTAGGGYRDFIATFGPPTAARDWELYE
jgi:hypothetical protein